MRKGDEDCQTVELEFIFCYFIGFQKLSFEEEVIIQVPERLQE